MIGALLLAVAGIVVFVQARKRGPRSPLDQWEQERRALQRAVEANRNPRSNRNG